MTTLITINRSWHQEPWLYERRFMASTGDTILLMEDAVISLQSRLALASFLAKCAAEGVSVCALKDDAEGRGVTVAHESVAMLSDQQFVALVTQHDKQIAW